jgi:DNA-directed RNA polymerase specialized sigma24 family protein
MRILQRSVREIVTSDVTVTDGSDPATPETVVLEGERRAAVHEAVARLPQRQRRVVASLLVTGIPMASIGPTRDRALARLREDEQFARAVRQ